MTATITPGPWRTGSGSYNDECRVETATPHKHPQSPGGVVMESRYTIAYCREPRVGEGRANARLIAKAPELLALAKQFASDCAFCNGKGTVGITIGGDGYGDRCAALMDVDADCEHCKEIRDVIAQVEDRS